MIDSSRRRGGSDLPFQIKRSLGVIGEQEVVKDEEGSAQGPTRGIYQLARQNRPWVVFPDEAGEVVHAGGESVRERVRGE